MDTTACSPVEAENTSEQLPQAILESVRSTSDVRILPAEFALVEEQQPHAYSPFAGVLLEGIATIGQKEDALKKKAEQMFQDLGLGRGIDATRTRPWLDRTHYQVRPVRFDDLIGTVEGGSLETYELAALSSQSLQMKMQMEIAAPITSGTPPVSSKLQIGVDCEYERTVSTERHVFGRRVINRTISFRNKFQDLPFLHQFASFPQSVDARQLSFEDALAKWVLEGLVHCHKQEGCIHRRPNTLVTEQSPSQALQDWLATAEHLDDVSFQLCIQKQCLKFVESLHMTHYVSAIKLGAAEYAVMTESMYLHKLKASGIFGLEKLVSSKVAASKSSHTASKMYKCQKLGIIEKRGEAAYVPRSSQQEAVINVEFQPIYQIVCHPLLRSLLQKAVQQYIRDQEDPRIGPFYIASYGINGKEKIVYLAVDKGKEQMKRGMLDHTSLPLSATTDKDSATPFKIIPSDEGDGLNDFNIVYEVKNAYPPDHHQVSQSVSSQRTSSKLRSSAWYYLCTPITVWGTCSSPPRFRLRSNEKDCLFVLRSPLKSSTKAPPEDLDPWLSGQEEYFIHCRGGHRWQRNGYLAVRPEYKNKAFATDTTSYVVTCCPSRDTGEHHFMLFKLLPIDKKATSN